MRIIFKQCREFRQQLTIQYTRWLRACSRQGAVQYAQPNTGLRARQPSTAVRSWQLAKNSPVYTVVAGSSVRVASDRRRVLVVGVVHTGCERRRRRRSPETRRQHARRRLRHTNAATSKQLL